MICPRCKSRYRRADINKPVGLLIPSKGPAPTELIVHSSDMTDHIGETHGSFELYLSICPCGMPLMAAVYEMAQAGSSHDYVPVVMTPGVLK